MRPERYKLLEAFSSTASKNMARWAHDRQAARCPGYTRRLSCRVHAPGKLEAGFELFMGRGHLKRYEYDMTFWLGF